MLKNYLFRIMAIAMIFLFSGNSGFGQTISINTLNAPLTQDFNSLSNTAATTTNNLTISGWYMTESGGGARDNEQYAVGTGGSNTGDTYSFGLASSTDRALGSIRSGTLISIFGAAYTNNTGGTITSLQAAYRGEQWRLGTAARTDKLDFQISYNATDLSTGTWVDIDALDFTTPNTTATIGAIDGNASGNFTNLSFNISSLSITNGSVFWIRWNDSDASMSDDGLAIDDFSLTPSGPPPTTPTISINDVTITEGNSGTTNAIFTVTLNNPNMGMGDVTFNYSTADGTSLPATQPSDYTNTSGTGTISYSTLATTTTISVPIVVETVFEPNETFFVNLSMPSAGTTIADGQGLGTISNDDAPPATKIHDIQGNNAATPVAGTTQTVEGIVVGDFQNEAGNTRLGGFYLQEEDTDADADPNTSEGIFIYEGPSGGLLKNIAVGDKVSVTGTVSEFNGLTEITVTSASNILIVSTANPMPTAGTLSFPSTIEERERLEGMLVTIPATMTITDNFDTYFRGELVIASNGKQINFTEANDPALQPALANYLADQLSKNIILDDDKNGVNNLPVYHFAANDGISNLRAGSTITGLTGILDYGFSFFRIRPLAPVVFANINARPTSAPVLTGKIKVATFNVLNFFNGDGMGGGFPTSRGAASLTLFNSQKAKIVKALQNIDADIVGLQELEKDGYGAESAIQELVDDLNTATSAGNYEFINPGTLLGGDEITVGIIYKPSKVTTVGAAQFLTTPNEVFSRSRVPLAQTFSSIGSCEKFSVVVNHFKSKGSPAEATGLNIDQMDGQGNWNLVRKQSAEAVRDWVTNTIIPAAGSSDVIILGDLNGYKKEDPIKIFETAGYTNLVAGTSYSFDGFFGSLDHLLSTPSLTPQYVDGAKYQVNSDEVAQIYQYDGLFPSIGTEYANSDHNPTIASFTKSVNTANISDVTTAKAKLVDNFLLNVDCDIISKVIPGTVSGNIDAEVTVGTSNIIDGIAIYGPRKYTITPTGTNGSATVTLYFTQTDFDIYNADPTKKDLPLNATDVEDNKQNLRIYKKSGSTTTEIDPTDTDINFVNNHWAVSFEVSSFSEFFLGSEIEATLPVTLLSFAGKKQKNANFLEWKTTNEKAFDGFEIQRSENGNSFEKIGFVKGANLENYNFNDNNLKTINHKLYYYRLKMMDLDGSSSLSKIIAIQPENESSTIVGKGYPNPVLDKSAFVEVTTEKAGTWKITTFNAQGSLQIANEIQLSKGINKVLVELSNLSKGIYFLNLENSNGEKFIRKVLKN